MNRLIKILSACWIPIVMSSCSATSSRVVRADPEIFRVGEVEVRLYADREAMVRSLPPIFALLAATRVGNNQIQVSGYYDRENKRIYAINDARSVIHEFKHYLEPDWKHGSESPDRDRMQNPPATKPLPIQAALPIVQTGRREATVDDKSDF